MKVASGEEIIADWRDYLIRCTKANLNPDSKLSIIEFLDLHLGKKLVVDAGFIDKLKTLVEKFPEYENWEIDDEDYIDNTQEIIKELRLLLGSLSCEETLQGKKTEKEKT